MEYVVRTNSPASVSRIGQAYGDHEITTEYPRRPLPKHTVDDRWSSGARARGRIANRSFERAHGSQGAEAGAAGLLSTADGADSKLRHLHGEGQRRTGGGVRDQDCRRDEG